MTEYTQVIRLEGTEKEVQGTVYHAYLRGGATLSERAVKALESGMTPAAVRYLTDNVWGRKDEK